MARLLVFRGDFVEHEIELGVTPLRIGRGADSDLVLDDPDKGVSRSHAELRFEGGGYVLVDLGSQNGIWQDGARVDRGYFDSNIAITLGPYRLIIDESAGSAVDTRAGGAFPEAARTPAARRRTYDDAYEDDQDEGDSSVSGSADGRRSRPGWLRSRAKPLLLGGGALVVAGAVGITRLVGGQGPSVEDRILQHLAGARTLLEQLEPQRAISEHLDPALAIDGANVEAQDLKAQAQQMIDRLGRSPTSSGSSAGSEAMPAEAFPRPASRPPSPPPLSPQMSTVPPAPGQSGVPGRAVEPLPDPARDARWKASLDDAKQLRDRGDYAAAERRLTELIREAGLDFADAKATLDGVRQRKREEGSRLFREADDDAANDRWDEAIAKYTRAREVDPTLVVDRQIAAVTEQKLQEGVARFKKAEVEYKFANNPEALRLYEEAVRLLPASHPMSVEAVKKIKELKK